MYGKIWLGPNKSIFKGVQELQLRPLDYNFLRFLLANPYVHHSHTALIEATWPDYINRLGVTNDALYQVVRRVRKNIEDNPRKPDYLINWRGTLEGGYRFYPEGRLHYQEILHLHIQELLGLENASDIRFKGNVQNKEAPISLSEMEHPSKEHEIVQEPKEIKRYSRKDEVQKYVTEVSIENTPGTDPIIVVTDDPWYVWLNDKAIKVSLYEYRLLKALAQRSGEPVSVEELKMRIWQSEVSNSNLYSLVSRVRNKFSLGKRSNYLLGGIPLRDGYVLYHAVYKSVTNKPNVTAQFIAKAT